MSEEASIDQIRTAAEGVLERARSDEGYRASVIADPVAALAAAGVPADAAEHIGIGEWADANADAQGFMRGSGACDRWTCIISICPNIPYTQGCGLVTGR